MSRRTPFALFAVLVAFSSVVAAQTAPTLDSIADPAAILEDSGLQTVNLSGIDDGGDGGQTLTVTATSDNTGLIPDPTVNYTSPDAIGSLDYTPVPDASGSAVITVTVTDADGSAVETFTVAVTAVDDDPVAVDDVATVAEDDPATTVDVLANDTDADGGPKTIASASDPAAGTVVVAGDGLSLTYQPDADTCNDGSPTDDFTYSLSPGGSTATVAVTVTCVDDDPVAVDDAATVTEGDAATTVDVLANDTDIDGGPKTIASASDPAEGTVVVAGDGLSLTYEPDADACNGGSPTDDFTYTLTEGGSVATVAVTVNCVNDEPSFTAGADQTVLEDAGAQSVAWATDVLAGPANESGQALTFNITGNTNAGLFAVAPAVDASGTLTYTPADDANGSADITLELMDDGGTANGGDDTSPSETFTISVTAVNDEPSFTAGSDETVLEDAGAQSVAWATGISAGPADEAGQALTFNVTGNTNPALFAAAPAVDAAGTLTYTAAANASGSADITVELMDDGGTADGGDDTSPASTFSITVTLVNDEPSFTAGPDQTVLEDSGAQSVAWATGISAGPADEAGQALTFNITGNTNAGLFAVAPAVDASGTLTYTPAADANGSADITLELMDDGGTANGGDDTSPSATFTISVTAVNDEPSFTAGPDQTVLEDAGAQSVAWATDISAGPADEAGQALTFNVTGNTNPGLFAAAPAVDAAGTLTYTAAANVNGSADITVELMDDGGTADGGDDTSPASTFSITVVLVNDEPSFVAGPDQSVLEDAGAQTVAAWATAISAGPADEAGQALTFNVTGNTNPGLFAAQPAVDAAGTLTYTPAANANGSADITIELMDDGGTDNGGDDTSPSATFNVSVGAVNDAPSFTAGGDIVTETGTGEQSVPWATNVAAGPPNESTQVVTFVIVSDDCGSLVTVGPAIDADGSLRFTPVDNTTGTCTITTKLTDDGGTADGGLDETGEVTFTLELVVATEPIADAASVTTDGFDPLTITLTGSDPDGQTPLDFQVLEPVTDQDTGEIISDTGPFRGTLDTFTPATNPDGVSADVVYTPDGPFLSNAVIIATNSVLADKFADVMSGDTVVNSSGGTITFERSTSSPAGFAVKADNIDAHGTASVDSDAFCNGGDFSSECDPLTLPVFDILPPFLVGDPDDANDVTVSGTVNLTPGLYGDVDIDDNGVAVFAPGKYSLRTLTAGKKAELVFSGSTVLMIADRFETGSNVDVGAAGLADQVVFYVAGTDGGSGSAVELGFNNANFFANLYAPNGTITVGQDSAVTGALLAQDVVLESKVEVALDSAFSEVPDQFAFEVTDQIGLTSEPAIVTINADGACRDDGGNIVAIAAFDNSANTDGAASIQVTLAGCEATDEPVTFELVSDGTEGSVTGLPSGPVSPPYEFDVTYTPNDAVPNERDSFVFSITNGVSTVPATVEINEPPCESVEVTALASVATDENDPLTLTLSGCDPNNEALSFATDPDSAGSFANCATCAISAPVAIADNRPGFSSANVVITHNETLATSTSFEYSATSSGGSDSTTVGVEVNPVNIAPVANDDAFAGSLGGVINGNVLGNDTDANLDSLSATVVSAPAQASNFTLNANGDFTYTHNGLGVFTDTFTYSASDGTLSDTATVSISIVAADITVSISKAGDGAAQSTVVSSPAGIDCGAVCSAVFMTTQPIRLEGIPADGFIFNFWSGDADCIDGEISPIADRSCVANFAIDTTQPPTGDPIQVTVLKDGTGSGTVSSDPAGIDCGPICTATITGDPRVTLSATADSGSVFAGFSGGPSGDCADGQLDAVVDTTCQATFNAIPRTLTVQFLGGSGTVTSTPTGISCTSDCSSGFEAGVTVTLSGRPDTGSATDVTWGGDCAPDASFPNKATVTMTADMTCTVIFN